MSGRLSPRVLGLTVLAGVLSAGAVSACGASHGSTPPSVPASIKASASLITPGDGQSLLDVWTPPADMPSKGKVSEVAIPGTVSKFPARDAYVYVPPAYLVNPHPQLPVLVLIHGEPGNPSDWVDGGHVDELMDAYASAHKGLAPIVIMPDAIGTKVSNPMCLNSKLGNAQTYLSVDVPDWAKANLQADGDRMHWMIGGYSYGGTCSIQLAVNAPRVFASFLDISGQDGPQLEDGRDAVQVAFGGDQAAYAAVNPVDVMKHTDFPDTAGVFVIGDDDQFYGDQTKTMFAAAKAAGMDVTLQSLPGGHSFSVWGPALSNNLDWIAGRLGIDSP